MEYISPAQVIYSKDSENKKQFLLTSSQTSKRNQ